MKLDPPTRGGVPLEQACGVALDALCDEGDLPGSTLANVDFAHEDVRGWDFRECVLRKCALANADLRGCSFVDVIFDHCDLSACRMENAVFHRTRFDTCRMTGADFPHIVARNAAFHDCKADFLNLTGAKLTRTRFSGCNLTESAWDSVVWKELELPEDDLTRAVFHLTTLKGLDLRACRLDGLTVDLPALRGAIVTAEQALRLAALMGLVIREG